MSSPILEVENLVKDFVLPLTRKKVRALNHLSFSVREGSVVGFLGSNGAGKTTTLKIILQLIFQTEGEVRLFGKSNKDPGFKNKIGFLTERPYFYDYLTGKEFLKFAASLFDLKVPEKKILDLIEEVGLSHAADRPLRRYSKGMLQRIGIAQALVNDPQFLILDEPMSGLDPDGRADICRIIRSAHKRGATVLFSSHLLPDVENLCDSVVMIDHGQLVFEDSVKSILEKESKGYELDFELDGNHEHLEFKTDDELQAKLSSVIKKGGKILKVDRLNPSLEEIFVSYQKVRQ